MNAPSRVAKALSEECDKYLAAQEVLRGEAFLSHFGRDGGVFWFDVRRRQLMLGGHIISDDDVLAYKAWCANNALHRAPRGHYTPLVAPRETVDEVVRVACGTNPRDEVHEYLESLRGTWDGVPRAREELPRKMGIRAPHEVTWLWRWLVSAVARAMRPGCKADCALMLVGAQGVGKSSGLAALFGDEWTHDSQLDMESKDGAAVMGRAWCVELAELSSLLRARDAETVKHFLSLREDTFRPAYGRIPVTTPRRAVVAGTTNKDEPLSDSTGNRRFWPVRVAGRIDVPWLAANRNALWAEVLAAFEAGEQWHLTGDEAAAHEAIAEDYRQQDALVEALHSYVENNPEGVSMSGCAAALDVEPKHFDKHLQHRVAEALRQLGLVRTRRGGRRQRWWSLPSEGVPLFSDEEAV